MKISNENKQQFVAAIAEVQAAVKVLGEAHRALFARYAELKDEVRSKATTPNAPVSHVVSNVASAIGPEVLNRAIVGAMIAAGLSALLDRNAMMPDGRSIPDLVAELEQRLG